MPDDLWGLSSTEIPTDLSSPDQGDLWGVQTGIAQPQQEVQQPTGVDRSKLMDVPTALVAGVTDLAEQFARARLAYGGHAGGQGLEEEHAGGTEDYVGQFANWLVINKEKFEKEHPYIYAPAKDEGELRRSIREGLRSTIPSLGAGIPGAVIGTTIGTAAGVPVAGAVAGFASSGGTIFGLAQYDQVVRDVLKHNAEHPESAIPEEVYKNEGFKQALIEGGFEAASNAIEAGFFGLGKLATQPVKESVRSILKQGWKGSAKNYLLAQAKAQPAEVLTEMAQNYLETQSNIDMGLPQEQTPWQAATNAIGPTVFSTMLIGAGFHGIDVKKRANITKALENPETDFDTRFDAMRTIYSELQKSDKVNGTNLAQKWGEIAQYKLLEGEAIELDKKFTDMKPLEGLLADKETAIQNDIDTNKFLERGKTPVETEEVIPEGEKKPDDDKTVRRTMGIELRQQLFDKFIEKGFSEEKANEMASFVMGAKDPSILTPNTQPSVILDKDGKPIEKEVPQDSTSGTIKLTYGKSIIQNIPENIKNQFVFTSKGELFSNKGAVKAILKKQGLSETYAPMMLAQNEWVGVPISMPQLTQDLYQIASGNRQQPLIKSTQQQEQVQGTTQTPVTPTVQPTTYENIQSDDLTNKGKPFTNKVSAKLAIQKNYKEMKYTGTEEKYVPVQIGEKQWVARRKESVPVQPKVESAQEYVNRRNAEYLAAKTPTEGLAKLNEIIIGLEELGHEKTKVYQRTVSRRNAVAKTIEREQRKEEKKNVKQEPIAKETIEEVSTVTQEEPTEVKPETQENVTSKEGGETNGQVQTETQVTPTKKVEKLRANAVEKRLKAGEDVTDEDVAKFKTLALRWTRNVETNKWEEHEPAYKVEQNKPTLTEEEREARADQRAIAKAEKNPKKIVKKTPRELIKKSQSELKKLKAELAKATTEQEREDLEYAIDSTRQDIKILANRLMAKKSSPKVQWFGEEDNGEETTKKEHPLAKHISYMSPVMAQEQIDHYTEVESDTGMRMLKKMSPVTMPRAFAAMINYAGHFSDGTVDLNMISKFIQQLEEGIKTGKLDNFFAPIESSEAGTYDEKESFKQDVATVKDLLQKTIDLGIVPKQSGNFQRVESNKGPGLSVKEVTDVADQILDLWPNSPFVIVLDNRDQLPPELKAKIAGDAGKYTIGGAQLGDTVFLIRNELHNKFDVERTLLHESIGHYGIYQTLGTKFDATALSVYDSFKDTDKMKKIIKDYGIDVNNEQDKIDAGAEYLGFMAEENLGAPTFWEKIKTSVNNILRGFGFDVKLNNADIKSLLADSQKFLEGKTGVSQNIESYFSNEKMPRLDKITRAPVFYSTLLQTVTTRTDMPTKTQSLLNWLNKFVKPAEMKWMGVEQYLKGKDKIDKKDFENFLKSNQIEVKEVTHADIPSDSPNKVKQLFENGAMKVTRDAEGNYHGWYYTVDKDLDSAEWFVSIHRDGRPYTTTYGFETEDEALDQGLELVDEAVIESNETNITEDQLEPGDSGQTTPTRYGQWVLPGGKNYKELLLIWNPGKSNDLQETLDAGGKPSDIYETAYQSGHWNEPNVIGHIRLDERTDDKGRSVLFIEEIQSDWLQAAKERGFSNNEEKNNLIKKIDQLTLEWEKARTAFDDYTDNRAYTVREARLDPEYQRLREEVNGIFMEREVANRELERLVDKPNIPRAPFLENWHEVFMKRMIRYAVDNNFDVVAWTTGKQQADRYNLEKHIDDLTIVKAPDGSYKIKATKNGDTVISKRVETASELADHIGNDLATKAIKQIESVDNAKLKSKEAELNEGLKSVRAAIDEINAAVHERGIDGLDKAFATKKMPSSEYYTRLANSNFLPSNRMTAAENSRLSNLRDAERNLKKQIELIKFNSVRFQGLDLQIGGKGMKVFYDEKLKNFTEKYIKQWGARLETASIPNKVNYKTYTDKWTSITDPDWSIEKGNDGKYFIYTSDTIIPKFGPAQTWNEAMELVRDNVSSHVLFNEEQNPDPNTDNLKQPGFTITAEMAKSVVEKGQPWFRKTDTQTEKELPFKFQNSNQEQVYKEFKNGQYYRYNALEGAGDVFRELALREEPDFGYISEKISHIENQIKQERRGIHPDDSFETSRRENQDAFKKLEDLWSKQPVTSEIQKVAVELNKDMLRGDFTAAEKNIQKIKDYFKEPSERANIGADIEPRGRLRIVDYADITPDAPKQELKNLFSDEAYAMLKTMVMQLPKNQPALHWAERYLMSPEWYKHPTMQKIVRAAIDRHDRYFELFNLLNEMEVNPETMRQKTWGNSSGIIEANVKLMHRGLSPTQILKGETSKEYKQLEKMKDQIDTGEWKEGYGENIPTWEQHFQNEGVGKDVIDLYKMHRAAYDKALDILMEPMQKLVKTIDKQAEKDKSKPKYPEFITLDEDGKPVKINLKAVLARMGSLKGTYAPRLRETGDYVVKGNRFGKVVRYHKSNRFAAELLKRELEKKGYKVEEIFERERLPEDVYASLRIVNTQQAIKTAMQRMEGVDPELETKFNEELLKEVADLIRVRGFRASMVTRKQGETIRGYITDPNERFARYINNISAGIAKGEAAKEMFETLAGHYEGEGKDKKLIGGIDPSKEPRAYDTATKYIEEQLRNSDAADRLVGLIKSLASFKYLGFNLRSPVVNILSLATTVPTAIHQYGLNGKGSMVKIMGAISTASNDYRKVMLGKPLNNKYEQALIDEIKTRGYDTPQYTRDALGTIQRTHGKVWAKTMAISMYLFGKSEQWIRGTTMLAAYRLTKSANPNMDEHDLIRKAHDVSDKAHGIYGKSTQLAVGQGTGPAARLSQILYTFGKFPHNYLQMLYDTGVRKGNIKAFLYGLISPVILGGATVIPMKNLLFGIVGLMLKAAGYDDDPEKGFWDWIRKKLGKTTERIGRHGLLGAANLDVSGSMSIGVGTPRNFYELFGVAGGLYKDIEDAMHFLQIGQPGRAAEKTLPTGMGNIFRAIRELNGVTTTKGQRVWDDQGKPYVPSTTETAARLAGFRSAEQATMSERTWETKREIASYKVRHDKILEQWRDYVIDKGSNEDMQHIMDAISKYNNSIMKSGKAGEIPFITNQTLKTQAKALYKPSKAMSVGMFKE